MNAIVINSSPRDEGLSKTSMLAEALVSGLREAGAQVDVFALRGKTVRNCTGCYTCWTKTPGRCIHRDDMSQEIFPRWLEADLAVYATPLYHFTVNAAMKAFIERTLPVLQPFLVPKGGATAHPARHATPAAVVLSVAGFPELSVFDQLSAYARFLFRGRLLAEIYRPGAETLAQPAFEAERREVLGAVRDAGRQLVRDRSVSAATLARISRPVGDPETVAAIANLMWRTCIAEGVTPAEFRRRGMIPRPDSLATFMAVLPLGFNPRAAGDLEATLQFDFTGEIAGTCHFRIGNGRIEALDGPAEAPTLSVRAPFEAWMDVMTGKADGQQLFLEGKGAAAGDLSLLFRLKQLFGG